MTLRDFGWPELQFLVLSVRWTILLSLIAFAGGGGPGIRRQADEGTTIIYQQKLHEQRGALEQRDVYIHRVA